MSPVACRLLRPAKPAVIVTSMMHVRVLFSELSIDSSDLALAKVASDTCGTGKQARESSGRKLLQIREQLAVLDSPCSLGPS